MLRGALVLHVEQEEVVQGARLCSYVEHTGECVTVTGVCSCTYLLIEMR